jgi:hypothetical protein
MSDWRETLRSFSELCCGGNEDVAAAIAAALAEIDRLTKQATCVWSLADDDASHWETGCGHAFSFNEDGPVENQQKFCGYCGGTLVPVGPETP